MYLQIRIYIHVYKACLIGLWACWVAAGMWDVVTAAHAICKGRTHPIDIMSVLQPPSKRYFAFLCLNFGLISNLDIGTEHLRYTLLHQHTFVVVQGMSETDQ